MSDKITKIHLIEACQQPGCPVCTIIHSEGKHFLNNLFYEQVNDLQVREDLRKSLGFCPMHAWLATDPEIGNALGLALIYRDVFNTLRKGLPVPAKTSSGDKISSWLQRIQPALRKKLQSIKDQLTPHGQCPACRVEEQNTAMVMAVLIKSLQDQETINALAASNGLCLPHLRQAFQQVSNAQDVDRLLALARDHLSRLDSELSEFIRKNDYRFSAEGFGPEGNSWKRAVRMAVGNRR